MRPYHLIPAVPALALALMPFLPFVNTDGLWFGLPRMLVWGAAWCVLCTPALLLTERQMAREGAELTDTTATVTTAEGVDQ
ncbi:hypothetical protein [Streptomyces prunicolor]|uniref:DUF3311 domain-containing protein n=1 Tax=Streptomyces prunicolor TaxID=67348 RepID=A0ABU4FS34_9ACTN|nr:hypothetical protein [Streptomyces prunicolor]MCX5238045.1 hypothetical protein [Streptomyces prunicolor]MDV7223426.1 hypothetical protein [Streptomyces prunicolor]